MKSQKHLSKIFILLINIFFSLHLHSQGWERIYTNGHSGLANDIIGSPDLGYLLAGINTRIDTHNNPITSVLIKKVDSRGDIAYEKLIQGVEGSPNLYALSDGSIALLSGFDNTNMVLVNLDPLGNEIWREAYPQERTFFNINRELFQQADGSFLIFNQRLNDHITIIKTDAHGKKLWTKEIALGENIHLKAITATPDGFAFSGVLAEVDSTKLNLPELGELFILTLNKAFEIKNFQLLEQQGKVNDLIATDQNELVLVGQTEDGQILIKKLDLEEQEIWSKEEYGEGLAREVVEKNGDLFVLGMNDQEDFLLKLEADGALNWERYYRISILGNYLLASKDAFLILGTQLDETRLVYQLRKTDSLGFSLTNLIEGRVVIDENDNCQLEGNERSLNGIIVAIENEEGVPTYTSTDEEGTYFFRVDTGQYDLKVFPPNEYWSPACNPASTINFSRTRDTSVNDLLLTPEESCQLLEVNLSAFNLIRGAHNQYYLRYCNQGTSPIQNGTIEVKLDSFLSIENAYLNNEPISFEENQGITYFQVDSLEVGVCELIRISTFLDETATTSGQIHCSEVEGKVDDICLLPAIEWDQSSLVATGSCRGDSVYFRIKNVGDGNMSAPSDYYIVIIDHVVLKGSIQLDEGEEIIIPYPAGNSLLRIEVDQPEGHPAGGRSTATVPGCLDLDIDRLLLQFYPYDQVPFIDIDCVENSGEVNFIENEFSDQGKPGERFPNTLQKNIPAYQAELVAFPTGIGDVQIIEPLTPIEYLVGFKFTEAFTPQSIVVLDTLSNHFDISTFKMMASSHELSYDISGTGILRVTFKNLEAIGNKAFFKFSIQPKADTRLGSVIKNQAIAYVNYNVGHPTNSVFHTLGYIPYSPDIITGIKEPIQKNTLKIMPNPFSSTTTIKLSTTHPFLRLDIYNTVGQHLKTVFGRGDELLLKKGNLTNGTYFFRLKTDRKILETGKLIIMD